MLRRVDDARDAANQDDPAAGLLQLGQGCPDEQGRPEHVGQHHVAPARGVADFFSEPAETVDHARYGKAWSRLSALGPTGEGRSRVGTYAYSPGAKRASGAMNRWKRPVINITPTVTSNAPESPAIAR
jgi:hypothetical protein